MIEKIFEYPSEKYYKFGSAGVIISDKEINEWINDCLQNIKKNIKKYPGRKSYFSNISSGNTRVSVEAYIQSINSDLFTVYVNVSKGYEQQSECDIHL